MNIAAVDFETYYDKTVSITTLGVWHYLRHELSDIYMVSIKTSDGREFVGHPNDAPWLDISGPGWTWLSHNAAFDEEVMIRLRELNGWSAVDYAPERWECTADMAAYLGMPRSLAGACKELLNIELSKDVRDKMKGKRWESMPEDFKAEVIQYALADAVHCLKLWTEFSDQWPAWERDLSQLTRKMGRRGVLVDVPLLQSYIGDLKRQVWEADKNIPWSGSHPALSYKRLCEECRKHNITPPVSLAMDSEDCAEWEDKHGDTYPWVGAMRQKRRANMLLKKFETLIQRVQPNGRASLPLKYCGASTRRWSGSAGFNAQNMSRDLLLGTEVRRCIIAPPGKKFVVPDLSQIEPRVLAVLCGDDAMLDIVRSGVDIYEAHARATMGYDRPEPLKSLAHIPEFERMRRLGKARVLGLGYSCGSVKFQVVAKILAGLELSEAESAKQVADYRQANPKIVKLWRKLQRALERSVGQDLTITLPSGNKLIYRKVAVRDGDYTALVSKGGRMVRTKVYGGLLCVDTAAEVLSHCRGWVALSSVTTEDLLWDGVEFVPHSGVAFKGAQPVVQVAGVWATRDHEFLTTAGWRAAETLCGLGYCDVITAPYETEVCNETKQARSTDREGFRSIDGGQETREHWQEDGVGSDLSVRGAEDHGEFGYYKGGAGGVLKKVSALPQTGWGQESVSRQLVAPVVSRVAKHEAAMPQPGPSGIRQLWRAGYLGVRTLARELLCVLGGHSPYLLAGDGPRPAGQRGELYAGQLPLGDEANKLPQQAAVGGAQARTSRGLFRSSTPSRDTREHGLLPVGPGDALGQSVEPAAKPIKQVCDVMDCGPRRRFVVRARPGAPAIIAHNCENLTQATARDIFATQLLAMDRAGIELVLQTHDEAVAEVDESTDASTVSQHMTVAPSWMPGIPLATEAVEGTHYAL